MSGRGLIDWRLAERMAAGIATRGEGPGRTYSAGEVAAVCERARAEVGAYTGLAPAPDTPTPELIDRWAWSRNALGTLAAAARPFEERVSSDLGLPGPLAGVLRAAVAAGTGAEAGIAVGYAARRVLGQYDFELFGDPRPARLLFVAPNVEAARDELGADRELFLRWIALHECTHVLQFEGVPWLAPHMRGVAGELLTSAAEGLDARRVASAIGRAIRSDPRAVLRAATQGEIVRLLAEPAQRERLDRLQATMAAIEGHAEHVMDACAAGEPELAELRRRLDARRARRGGLGAVVGKLLGLEMKLRQYEQGKAFFDAVSDAGGEPAVRAVWSAPESLPAPEEVADPRLWLARTGLGAPVSA